mmetsp:Transcript_22106/g.44158  ORF Transcript_22106/g.44158 Transcript_22106/m.44158 type:complete len:289 (-) Transcript_22106:60-926(-)
MSTSEQLSSAPAAAAATSTSASTTTSTSSSSTTPINPLTGNLHNTLLSVTSTGASTAPGAPTTQLTIQIQNLTTTLNLHCPLDLRRISSTIMNTEYAPSKFGACIMRLMNPKCTCLLFASGKCVITGSRSIHNAHLSSRKLAYILTKLQFPVTNPAFKVRNMIGTLDLGFPVRLEGIVYDHAKFASYEPELFPGLIYRCLSPKVVLLVFVSGKVVITGAKDEGDMARVMEKMFPVLEEYKKTTAGAQPPRTQQQVQQGQRLITQGGEAGQQQQQQNNNSSTWRRPEAL